MTQHTSNPQVIVRQWLAGPPPADVSLTLNRVAKRPDVRRLVVLPDVHAAGDVCVGTVLATRQLVYPAAVGGDIGCGMLTFAFSGGADRLASQDAAGRLFRRLYERVPTNRHHEPRDLPPELLDQPLSDRRLQSVAARDGRVQLGTLGRGNHFLEFQADEDDRLWLCVHSGSRAIGQAVRDFHVTSATPSATPTAGELVSLDADTPAGQRYLADAEWARAYADANRRAMLSAAVEAASEVLGIDADASTVISCDHNHVRREIHFGEALWVHRKGAMPASAGEPGILPGSMGTATYHVEGRGEAESLCSSSHGAGRSLSREQARSVVSEKELRRQLANVWFDPRAADRLRDEAPSAYKDVAAVLRAQRELTRVARKLRPVLVYKGS